jgi:uncharacterized protein YcbK (DUF882 family)
VTSLQKLRLLNSALAGLLRGSAVKTALLTAFLTSFIPGQTQNAVANGDTRTISLYHTHTGESITATFRVNGAYDQASLDKLNYFLRDWRNNDSIKMDPRLFDVVWETYRESGSREPIHIVSSYRSPMTNAMLRRRSKAVAEHSQHMLGKAMDMHYTDVSMSRVREIGIRLQRGGVGYYPTAGSPFVHLDVGSVRAWPRMTYDQLARIFPDGKTVHLASNGQTLARYDEARAQIESRNGISVPTSAQAQSRGFFATLFGSREDEPAAAAPAARGSARTQVASASRTTRAAAPAADAGVAASYVAEAARRNATIAPPDAAPALRGRGKEPDVVLARVEPKPTVLPEPIRVQEEAAPMPPRRPVSLMAPTVVALADIPRPPSRPTDARTAIDDAPIRMARAELPNVITGAKTPPAAASSFGALSFAPSAPSLTEVPKPPVRTASLKTSLAAPVIARPVGMRAALAPQPKSNIIASKLDRSNFRALTSPEAISRMKVASVGPVVTSLRAAAKADITSLVFAEPTNIASRFERGGADVSHSIFSGAAVRALPRLETAQVGKAAQIR